MFRLPHHRRLWYGSVVALVLMTLLVACGDIRSSLPTEEDATTLVEEEAPAVEEEISDDIEEDSTRSAASDGTQTYEHPSGMFRLDVPADAEIAESDAGVEIFIDDMSLLMASFDAYRLLRQL